MIVSDNLPLDVAVLGLAGYKPGYPGPDKFPPQPMVRQIRSFLNECTSKGGTHGKVSIEGLDTLFIEKPKEFIREFASFID